MNREEFISYLKKPASLDKRSLPEINELIEEFPFFQSGHLLFLKNLNNLDHIRFGSQLKKSSSIVSNRERLYELLFPAIQMDTDITIESEIEVKPAKHVINEAGSVPVVGKPVEEKLPDESHESDASVNQEEVKEEKQKVESEASPIQEGVDSGEDKTTDDLRAQVERRLAEIRGGDIPEVKEKGTVGKVMSEDVEDKEKQVPETIAPEEESIDTEEEIEAGEGMEIEPIQTSGVDEKPREEKPDPSDEIIEKGTLEIEVSPGDSESHANNKNGDQNIIEDKESNLEERTDVARDLLLLGDEKEVGDLPGDIEYPIHEEVEEKDASFMEESLLDLDYPIQDEDPGNAEDLSGDKDGEEPGSSEAELEKEIESGDFEDKTELKEEIHSFESWLNLLGTGHSDEDLSEMNESVSEQREIIDKFIQENPRIQPNQDDHYEKEDMSVESVTEKDELFTETLANIYIKQGYYSRAIFFYQELSLKFPEKSAYFARRIKEIEKRINKL